MRDSDIPIGLAFAMLKGARSRMLDAINNNNLSLILEERQLLNEAVIIYEKCKEDKENNCFIGHKYKKYGTELVKDSYTMLQNSSYQLSSSLKCL